MPARVITWNRAKAKEELNKRLHTAMEARAGIEVCWDRSEQTVFNTGGPNAVSNFRYSFESDVELGMDTPDNSASDIGINMAFKHWRFITAQMSANPPTVVARPTSSDYTDKRKADAADRLVRHAIRDKKLQEIIDLTSSKAVLYGTAYIKTVWDPDLGDIVDIIDEKKGIYELEGEICVSTPSTRCIYLDPDAKTWDDVKWVFEAHILTTEEAEFRWPEHWEEIKTQIDSVEAQMTSMSALRSQQKNDMQIKKVTVYEYYERGLPYNGMVGRHGYCLLDGTPLGDIGRNPFAFSPPKQNEDDVQMPATAYLPYHILTDIDVPDQVYGKSFVEYEALLQDTINRLDSAQLDNVQAHGVTRLVLPEGAEVAKGSFTNSPWDIVEITGSQPPFFMTPPAGVPDIVNLRDRLTKGADDVAGYNEAMGGQTSRETSGFSMQYAVNQGNMIRRRLFNKYVLCVESVFKAYLNLVRDNWDEPRTIKVLGKEKAFESAEIKGADIQGGFDIVVEYGASLSLDPGSRRDEIMQMYPLLIEAGMEPRKILSLMKLSELESGYDLLEQAGERQYEDFQKMIATKVYVAPEEMQEHKGRLAFAYEFLETVEFKYLPDEIKALLREHVKAREAMAAAAQQPGMPGVPAGPVDVTGGPRAPAPEVTPSPSGAMAPMAAGGGQPGLEGAPAPAPGGGGGIPPGVA